MQINMIIIMIMSDGSPNLIWWDWGWIGLDWQDLDLDLDNLLLPPGVVVPVPGLEKIFHSPATVMMMMSWVMVGHCHLVTVSTHNNLDIWLRSGEHQVRGHVSEDSGFIPSILKIKSFSLEGNCLKQIHTLQAKATQFLSMCRQRFYFYVSL